MPVERIWDEEARHLVMQMLDHGASASAIAAIYAISRNAAIGRIARDPELHGHVHVHIVLKKDRPGGRTKKPRINGRMVDRPPRPETPRQRPPVTRRVPMLNLGPNQCRWPVEEDRNVTGGFLFCGATTDSFQPYCRWHTRLARPGGQ